MPSAGQIMQSLITWVKGVSPIFIFLFFNSYLLVNLKFPIMTHWHMANISTADVSVRL